MEGLGIEPKLLLAQIINFLVLFFVLKKFLYMPLLQFLDERKKKIEEGLLNTQKIEERLAKIEEKQAEILRQAKQEANQIINRGKKAGEEEKEKILQEARQKAEEEVKKAGFLAKQELEKAKQELRHEAVSLAAALAGKILGHLPESEKRKLVDEALRS